MDSHKCVPQGARNLLSLSIYYLLEFKLIQNEIFHFQSSYAEENASPISEKGSNIKHQQEHFQKLNRQTGWIKHPTV